MESEMENNGRILNKNAQILGEADDIVIGRNSIFELKEIMKQLMKSEQVMRINMQKTKHVEITKKSS